MAWIRWILLWSVVASASVMLDSRVSRSELYIGDRFQYQIRIAAPVGSLVELPGVIGNLSGFEVRSFAVRPPKDSASWRIHEWDFELRAFFSGEFLLPPQWVVIRDSTGSDSTLHYTQPVQIKVLSRGAQDMQDIAEAASPLFKKDPIAAWVWWVAILLPILLGVLWFWWRRTRYPKNVELPPHILAFNRLAELKALIDSGEEPKEVYFLMTHTIKSYLQAESQVALLDSVTAELEERLQKIDFLTQEEQIFLLDFAQISDAIKFAGQVADAQRMQEHWEHLNRMVQHTHIRLEERKKMQAGQA
jgi:hypothetical protein